MTDEQLLLVDEPAEHVRRITLNRPHKRNAISTPMRAELLDALHRFDADPGVRVTVVRGAGPCFSSGYDLSGGLMDDPPHPNRFSRFFIYLSLFHIFVPSCGCCCHIRLP